MAKIILELLYIAMVTAIETSSTPNSEDVKGKTESPPENINQQFTTSLTLTSEDNQNSNLNSGQLLSKQPLTTTPTDIFSVLTPKNFDKTALYPLTTSERVKSEDTTTKIYEKTCTDCITDIGKDVTTTEFLLAPQRMSTNFLSTNVKRKTTTDAETHSDLYIFTTTKPFSETKGVDNQANYGKIVHTSNNLTLNRHNQSSNLRKVLENISGIKKLTTKTPYMNTTVFNKDRDTTLDDFTTRPSIKPVSNQKPNQNFIKVNDVSTEVTQKLNTLHTSTFPSIVVTKSALLRKISPTTEVEFFSPSKDKSLSPRFYRSTPSSFSNESEYLDLVLTTTSPAVIVNSSGAVWPVKHAAIVEGDIVLGGLMMVHEREDSVTCGPVMPQGGIQALEAMLYTLDRINADPNLLPNITLGAHILDDCDKDTYGLEMAVDFIKGK